MRSFRAALVVPFCCVLSALAGCVAEPTEVGVAEQSGVTQTDAPVKLGIGGKATAIAAAQKAFGLSALQVNEDEVLEVTIDDPRIVDRAALGTRFMSWGDPETSAVTAGSAKYYPNAAAPNPYVRLRVDASFGDLYLVDCRVTDGTYYVTVQDVSGMGGGSQDLQIDTPGNGHLLIAFDPGPGGYKQLYISKSTGKTQYWALWGCEVTPLE